MKHLICGMNTSVYIVLLICASCKENINTPPIEQIQNDLPFFYTNMYTLRGDTLVISLPRVESVCCDENNKLSPIVLQEEKVKREIFKIVGDTLWLYILDPLEKGDSNYAEIVRYTKKKSEAGIYGTWYKPVYSYCVFTGTISSDVRQKLESKSTAFNNNEKYWCSELEITYGKIIGHMDYLFADYKIHEFEVALQPYYDLELTKLSKYKYTCLGKKTGEIVTYEYIPNSKLGMWYDMKIVSSNPDHKPFLYISPPVSCPNPFLPEWSEEFLEANRKDSVNAVGFKEYDHKSAYNLPFMVHSPLFKTLGLKRQ